MASPSSSVAHAVAEPKPLMRGVSHQIAFFVSILAGALLVRLAQTPQVALRAGVYAGSLMLLFGVSALYHRPTWGPRAYRWMRRLDHSAIFVLIAGTYSPVCLLLEPAQGQLLLAIIWVGAAIGSLRAIFWVRASKPFIASTYVAMGWAIVGFLPELLEAIDGGTMALLVAGGLLYTIGALVFALRRPNPWPRVFGFHEIFHLLVIVAAACHFAAVARLLRALG